MESEEAARDEWLDSPEAIRQREESRTAFDDLAAVDAEVVLGSVFEDALKQLDGDPARALSDMQIEEVVSDNGALVSDGEGGKELVESPIPIRSKVPGEEGKTVDLDLKETEGGFESKSPAADIRLPGSLGGQVEVGEELAFASLPGNGGVAATRFGDKDLFYPNTDTDSDTLIAPLARSVEVFQQLRSPKSPEQFRYGLKLPQDTTLRSDGEGGAEAVNPKGERVASVPAPFATDAQGTKVPVSMAIEGDSVVVEIAHRSMDLAYPLLLDPELVNDAWYWEGNGPSGLEYWGWTETADYEDGIWCTLSCWGWGLYARSKGSNHWYGGNTYGQWIYTAPNSTAYIAAATFWTIKGNSYNCLTNQPHGYVGIYNVYSGSYNSLGIYSPPSGYSSEFQTGWVGGNGTRLAVVGIGTGSSPSQLACGHDFYVAGALLNQDDPEDPSVSASGMPSGWISDATPAFTINSNGSDPGLGVRKTTLGRDGQPAIERPVGCNGTAGSRCPVNRNEQFNVSALSFDEGKKNAWITVEDATGEKTTQTWQTYVDMTKPDVTLSGQLAVATDEDEGEQQGNKEVEELSLPVYNLDIKATDVGTEQNADYKKRSGVRKIEVLLDEVKKQEWTQSCSDSCSMEKTYPLKLNNLSAGEHVLEVIATDGVGKKREREIEFEYIPATGMKDEYVMHYFPLPDGSGNEAEEEHPERPELAVNVMNGNLVYREKDVDVEGYSVDLEVERYYNSLLPEQENTEWGDGWTLAQTPDLEPEETEGAPKEAIMVRTSGAVEGSVGLPTAANEEVFDPELQAVVTKDADGGYEVADESGETGTAIAFDETGQTEALITDGYAKVDYGYEGGDLAEIAVEDPGSTDLLPEEAEVASPEPPVYANSFGSQGTGNGQFEAPAGIAVHDGDVWVVDVVNHRVQKFNSNGKYLGQFGEQGTGNGQFKSPYDLAIDPTGDIYVVDTFNHRVQKFDSDGKYLSQFGSKGSGNGQFKFPTGVATDSAGNVYVTDNGNNRVQKFGDEGEYVGEIGSFKTPRGIAVDSADNIYVVEEWGHRVKKFDSEGKYLSQFGEQGTDDGQLRNPWGIAVDATNSVFVADTGNNRVQVFDSAGKYLSQFGEEGTGNGQFKSPYGVAIDPEGAILVTDRNYRVQWWTTSGKGLPYTGAIYTSSFGTPGTGNGQFEAPAGIAVHDGNTWVVDAVNHRVQKFDSDGDYLSQFGEQGTGNGQFKSPYDLAIDPTGDIYVVDTFNHRVQKFDSDGKYLSQFGSKGSGNGQFKFPTGVATDSAGNVYVTDNGNNRVQKFGDEGEYLGKFGTLNTPRGIAVDSVDNVYVADEWAHRVVKFDSEGKYLGQFGQHGTGDGQLRNPWGIAVAANTVFVADTGNDRVQAFDSDGKYLSQLGEEGTGDGQFESPYGVAIDDANGIWVTDAGNDRLQKFLAGTYTPPPAEEAESDDPAVEVETEGGLVDSVEGEEAGTHLYGHEGDLLTAHVDADGMTEYEYDEAGRMTRVELPNGTWAEIEYGETDGRVKKVTVDPAGSEPEKSTTFSYTDQPRSTKVILPDAPAITYDIGEDGSVFKWQNALKPPEFEVVSGTLYDVENKETAAPIAVGDYNLVVKAYSEEGIASIHVYANGNQLISEKTCPQVYEEPEACKKLPDEWVTHTGNHAPGILDLEMVIEDRIGQVASKRFWVNIPYTPPPPPDQPVTPKFSEVLQFREEYGLDLDLDPVQDELEINDRVFDTINDWIQGNPVAEASMEKWGAPLRTPEVVELEYRQQYIAQAANEIPEWAKVHAPATYAGHYVDHREGGVIHVGFTADQLAHVQALKEGSSLIPDDRVEPFDIQPNRSMADLTAARAAGIQAWRANSAAWPVITVLDINVKSNSLSIGARNVAQATNLLSSSMPPEDIAGIYYDTTPMQSFNSRFRTSGPLHAGDHLLTSTFPCPDEPEAFCVGECTNGYGAWQEVTKKATGERIIATFGLTAAHCFIPGRIVKRAPSPFSGDGEKVTIGEVRRYGANPEPGRPQVDVEAFRLNSPGLVARTIHRENRPEKRVTAVGPVPPPGSHVCHSGPITRRIECGPVLDFMPIAYESQTSWGLFVTEPIWQATAKIAAMPGDSGGPVWNAVTGEAVGLLTGGDVETGEVAITPLLPLQLPEVSPAENIGALAALELQPGSIALSE